MMDSVTSDYYKFLLKHPNWVHYKIDSDEHTRIKLYYDVRHEPFFQVLLQGMNIKRIVGYNFDHISNVLRRVENAHHREIGYLGNTKELYMSKFDKK